jgi:hypothetical protein
MALQWLEAQAQRMPLTKSFFVDQFPLFLLRVGKSPLAQFAQHAA